MLLETATITTTTKKNDDEHNDDKNDELLSLDSKCYVRRALKTGMNQTYALFEM